VYAGEEEAEKENGGREEEEHAASRAACRLRRFSRTACARHWRRALLCRASAAGVFARNASALRLLPRQRSAPAKRRRSGALSLNCSLRAKNYVPSGIAAVLLDGMVALRMAAQLCAARDARYIRARRGRRQRNVALAPVPLPFSPSFSFAVAAGLDCGHAINIAGTAPSRHATA